MQRPDSGKGWIPALVVALGLGTAAGTAIPRQPLASEPNQPAESNTAEATPAQDTSSQESEPPTFLAHLRPVMGLLEEALGVDPEPTQEIRAAAALHQYLCSLPKPSRADRRAAVATAVLWRRLDAKGYATHVNRSGHVDHGESKWATEVLAGYSPEKLPKDGHIDAARKTLVEHFQRQDADEQRFLRLARTRADVQFIIATIADYVDSSSGWYADQQIDAIQSGMGRLGYVLDRFYLPDWSVGEVSAKKQRRRRHEREPGAIFFRKIVAPHPTLRLLDHMPPGTQATTDPTVSWVVVLLATETPTYGLHSEAFLHAGQFAATWQATFQAGQPDRVELTDGARPSVLRVLGPTYSGSISSLRRLLRDMVARSLFDEIEVVSGSANLDSNQEALEFPVNVSSKKVSFRTTVTPSGQLVHALNEYLRALNKDWGSGKGVAFLRESNTAFGSPGSDRVRQLGMGEEGEALLGRSTAPDRLTSEFPKATYISFPLHISRLRQTDANTATAQSTSWVFPRGLIPLKVSDATTATDHLPPLSPDMAAATVQAAMTGILQTLRRESIQAVGILATDDRDVLYLARELRRATPNVQLFFMSSHMLYLHPEFVPYTKGSLIASTYPLFTGIQRWMPQSLDRNYGGMDQRHQFYSMINEGISNAVLVLLRSVETPLTNPRSPNDGPLLSNYYPVRTDATRVAMASVAESAPKLSAENPPIWISVVGRDAFWPLRQLSDPVASFVHPVTPIPDIDGSAIGQGAARGTTPQPLVITAFFALALFVLWHVFTVFKQVAGSGYLVRRSVLYRVKRRWALTRFCLRARSWREQMRRRHYFELRGSLKPIRVEQDRTNVVAGWKGFAQDGNALIVRDYQRVFTVPTRSHHARHAAHLLIFTAFAVLGLAAFWVSGLFWVWLTGGPPNSLWHVILLGALAFLPCLLFLKYGAYAPERQASSKIELLVLGVFALCIVAMVTWGAQAFDTNELNALLHYERSIAITSFVSPIVPLLLLLATIYLWIRWHLDRISQQSKGYTHLFGPGPSSTTPPTLCGLLLWGTLSTSDLGKRFISLRARFIELVDSPLKSLVCYFGPAASLAATFGIGVSLYIVLGRVHTVEGLAFTDFFRAATGLSMTVMLLALIQTVVLWSVLRPLLMRLEHSGFSTAFTEVSELGLDWRLNLRLPRKDELRHLMRMIDRLSRDVAAEKDSLLLAGHDPGRIIAPPPERHARKLLGTLAANAVATSLVLDLDDECVRATTAVECQTLRARLARGMAWFRGSGKEPEKVALLLSPAFYGAWQTLQSQLVALREWHRAQRSLLDTKSGGQAAIDLHSDERNAWALRWFKNAETATALALAFVIRDLLSRVVSGLSIATIGFFLILFSHLLYSFQGRSMLLTLDWVAVAATSAIALYIVVQMERNEVLSRLWKSTPGRVNFNREFVGRVAIYGALPLVTIVSGVFPEIGDTLFSWLAPVRQLVSF